MFTSDTWRVLSLFLGNRFSRAATIQMQAPGLYAHVQEDTADIQTRLESLDKEWMDTKIVRYPAPLLVFAWQPTCLYSDVL